MSEPPTPAPGTIVIYEYTGGLPYLWSPRQMGLPQPLRRMADGEHVPRRFFTLDCFNFGDMKVYVVRRHTREPAETDDSKL